MQNVEKKKIIKTEKYFLALALACSVVVKNTESDSRGIINNDSMKLLFFCNSRCYGFG